jgi:hypothetical protein
MALARVHGENAISPTLFCTKSDSAFVDLLRKDAPHKGSSLAHWKPSYLFEHDDRRLTVVSRFRSCRPTIGKKLEPVSVKSIGKALTKNIPQIVGRV